MTSTTELVCPKCRGRMRNYDRSGILVEQCEDCRGIFLDRGELERLIEAEGGGWSGRIAPPGSSEDHESPPRTSEREPSNDDERREGDDELGNARPGRDGRVAGLLDLFGE